MIKEEKIIYTLITGASSGLGKALAHECASRGMNLILTSLPDEGLKKLKREITDSYNVHVLTYELDLTDRNAAADLVKKIRYLSINFLINNAGIGGAYKINDVSLHRIDSIIALNISAITYLTFMLLPELSRHAHNHILNVSSIISQYPAPFKTVYPASKAFIYSFTRGLSEELRNTKTTACVLLPGPMRTNGSVTKRIAKYGLLGRVLQLDPKGVAKVAITETLKGKKVIIPGVVNKLCWLLMKIIPVSVGISLMRMINSREVETFQTPALDSQLRV